MGFILAGKRFGVTDFLTRAWIGLQKIAQRPKDAPSPLGGTGIAARENQVYAFGTAMTLHLEFFITA